MKYTPFFRQVRDVAMKRLVASLIRFGQLSCGFGPVACLSTSCHWSAGKKSSQYGSVDIEKYSFLVRSVVSSRTSSQNPTSLLEEDERLFGPVVKSKPAPEPTRKISRNVHPMVYLDKTLDPPWEEDQKPPTRIALQRGPHKSAIPSVTRILQQTMSPEQIFYLERWRKRMIAELGEEGFNEYTLNTFRQGKCFHSALESILTPESTLSEEDGSSELVNGYIESVQHVLRDIHEVRAIESVVQHQDLNYLGLVDCIATYRGESCAIEWKTSEKRKPYLQNTYDNPLQVAAYIGAVNSDDNYNYQVQNGLIVVAYKDGTPAHAHFMTPDLCLEYWTRWLLRLEKFADNV